VKTADVLRLAGVFGTVLVVGAPSGATAGDGAEPAYITGAPVPDWLGLATVQGRDAIQLGDGCGAVVPGVNVVQLSSEDVDLALQVVDPILGRQPDVCVVVERRHMSNAPCARNPSGVCDVAFS
jgi:hypothetical protein